MRLGSALFALLLAGTASADSLVLKDGGTISGEIRRATGGWEVTDPASGTSRIIREDEVVSVQPGGSSPKQPDEATGRLLSMRRAVDAMSDINAILARYEVLLKQIGGTPSAREAAKDVAMWQERKAAKMVKVGKEWYAPLQLAALDEANMQLIERARNDAKAKRWREVLQATETILDKDPDQVAAIYLRGLAQFRLEQFPAARRSYDQLEKLLPSHGPSLNNLAAILWRQKAYGAALLNYAKAMQNAPLNSTIHDNVAEALYDLPEDHRDSYQKRRLEAQFQEDEPRLAQKMAESGWYRWGATWVGQQQYQQLQEQEVQIRQALDELAKRFEAAEDEVAELDAELASNAAARNRLENLRYYRDERGEWHRLPYPPQWDEYNREYSTLTASRVQALRKLDSIQREAASVRAQRAVPLYTGNHRLFDEQSTPIVLRSVTAAAAPSPTTKPANQPN